MAKKSVLMSRLAAIAVVGGLVYWVLSVDDSLVPIPAPSADIEDKNTVAYRWQWEQFTGEASEPTEGQGEIRARQAPVGEVPYDVVEIYNILQTMSISEDGLLVFNEAARQALDQGYSDLGSRLNSSAMAQLQDLIRKGLPGDAGEQAALTMENYYQYRLAEAGYNAQLQAQNVMPAFENYEQVMQLRRSYLTEEVASALFAVEETQATHMFAVMALHQNTELSEEEREQQQQALQDQLNDRLLSLGQVDPEDVADERVQRLRTQGADSADIFAARERLLGAERAQALAMEDREEAQWQRRFDGFWQAHQQVAQAGLSESDSQQQINALLSQYFSGEEIERARITIAERESDKY